jgi:hypothetical protein
MRERRNHMATKKPSTAKKGKKPSKPLRGEKHLEATKNLSYGKIKWT